MAMRVNHGVEPIKSRTGVAARWVKAEAAEGGGATRQP